MNRKLGFFVGGALVSSMALVAVLGWNHWLKTPSPRQLMGQQTADLATDGNAEPASKKRKGPPTSSVQPPETTSAVEEKDRDQEAAAGSREIQAERKQARLSQPSARPSPAKEKRAKAAVPMAPSFDIVRVEPDGSAVIAGRAAPHAQVEIIVNGRVVARVKADETGAWTHVSDAPLFVGDQQLVSLRARTEDSRVAQASQAVVVSMLPARQGGKPLVMLSRPNAPSRVLQKPAAPSPGADGERREALAKAEKAQRRQLAAAHEKMRRAQHLAAVRSGALELQRETEKLLAALREEEREERQARRAREEGATSQEKAPASQEKAPATPLELQTVDYDSSGAIYFTGRSAANASLRLYVDNRHLADVRADETGAWSWKGTARIAAGRHVLRIDRLMEDGRVVERIELPFVRASREELVAARQHTAPSLQQPVQTEESRQEQEQHLAAAQLEEKKEAGASMKEAPRKGKNAGTIEQDDGQAHGQDMRMAAATGPDDGGKQPARTTDGKQGGFIIVQPGNNLWNIARVIYGRGIRYTTIYEANREQIRDPDLIYPGQVFTAPGLPPRELRIPPQRRTPLKPEELN